MASFLVGVVSSLVASAILLSLTYIWSAKFREAVIGFILRGSRGIVARQWPNRRAGEATFVAELRRAQWMKFFGSRGLGFQTDLFESIMVARPANSSTSVRVLLPDTLDEDSLYWIRQREAELAKFDRSFSGDLLRDQIEATVKAIEGYSQSGMLELRRHRLPHFGRVVITDNVIFVVGFTARTHGYQDPMAMYDYQSPVYVALNRLFDITWDSLSPA
jgi:hypothetical protein